MAAALGVAAIGLIFATLSATHENALHAFVLSLLLVTLLSVGLSLTVLPLRKEQAAGLDRNSPSPSNEEAGEPRKTPPPPEPAFPAGCFDANHQDRSA